MKGFEAKLAALNGKRGVVRHKKIGLMGVEDSYVVRLSDGGDVTLARDKLRRSRKQHFGK